MAVTDSGAVYSWGLNHDGQLGLGKRRRLESGGASLRPQQVFISSNSNGDDIDNDVGYEGEAGNGAKVETRIDFQDDKRGRGAYK